MARVRCHSPVVPDLGERLKTPKPYKHRTEEKNGIPKRCLEALSKSSLLDRLEHEHANNVIE